jgi:hypothetical protein
MKLDRQSNSSRAIRLPSQSISHDCRSWINLLAKELRLCSARIRSDHKTLIFWEISVAASKFKNGPRPKALTVKSLRWSLFGVLR